MSDTDGFGVYRSNGHEFEAINRYPSGAELVQCTECLITDVIDETEDAPEEYLDLMTPQCHIEWLREPDSGFHGVALRNASAFSGRQLVSVDSDREVQHRVRVYDDDSALLASMLDLTKWGRRE